jgi:hypothetical protein
MWDGESPMVSLDVLQLPVHQGGKGLLDLSARNKAIELMKVKAYLNLETNKPRWAMVADELIGRDVSNTPVVVYELSKINTFLQSWAPRQKNHRVLPKSLQQMLKVAKSFGVKLDAPTFHPTLQEEMPIWHHKSMDPMKRVQNNSIWADCQRTNHHILTVGEMYRFTTPNLPNDHKAESHCICNVCSGMHSVGCMNPHKCRLAA